MHPAIQGINNNQTHTNTNQLPKSHFMKGLFITAAICLLSVVSFAQLSKGGTIVTLQGNGSFSNMDGGTSYALTVQPGYKVLVSNNVAIGFDVNYGYSYVKYPDYYSHYSQSIDQLEVGPVVRGYYGESKLKPYLEFGAGWYYFSLGHSTYEHNRLYLKPAAGISYWFDDRVSTDLNISYVMNEGYTLFEYDQWDISFGFAVKLGE